jgi:hypothetical protein
VWGFVVEGCSEGDDAGDLDCKNEHVWAGIADERISGNGRERKVMAEKEGGKREGSLPSPAQAKPS